MGKIQALETGLSILWKSGKSLPKGKINPKTLGYIRPDGVINFQTSESAQAYAKNRVLSALHAPKPFERAVLTKDSRIIGDINGTVRNVHIDPKIIEGHKDVVLVHGHPTGLPLSDQDYACLVTNDNLRSIVAYNKRGEYSRMTKQKESFILKLLPQKICDYIRFIKIMTSESMCNKFRENDLRGLENRVIEIFKTHRGMTKEEILATEEGQKLQNSTRLLLTKISDIWAKNERFFGIKYETDFSRLMK